MSYIPFRALIAMAPTVGISQLIAYVSSSATCAAYRQRITFD